MAQIFQPELTDSFEIKSDTVSQSDNVTKTVQEIYNYGVSNNYGNCFILYDNANNFLQNKGGYQIRYFTLTSLLTPRKIYLGSSNYLYNNGVAAGGTKIQHAIGVAMRMRSGEYETINVATFSTNGNSYSIIVNTNENFTISTGGFSGTTIYVNEDAYGSDYYTSYFGSGLHSGYDEVIYIDPSIYDELYIDGQLVPKANATIRVNYYLPDDTYEYTKLTYKKNVQPESVNDGTIVNLDPTQDSVTVKGLIENASYWFKIFTNKSESEAFPYTVEVDPVPPEYKQYIEKINGRIKDYEYFYWYDLEQFHPYGYDYIDGYKYVPLTSLSYYCYNVSSGASNRYYAALSKTAVYIVKEDDHYIASIDSNYIPQFDLAEKVTPGWAGRFTQYGYPNNTSDVNNVTRMHAWNSTELVNETPFSKRLRYGDLTIAFTDLSKRVKNIDIYVDGVLWSKVDN